VCQIIDSLHTKTHGRTQTAGIRPIRHVVGGGKFYHSVRTATIEISAPWHALPATVRTQF